ncbi:hypothetical protein [Paenibacillus konkukensis]|uniref:hypothetical protein n=1 Tax=Paenibacillus konkukensis TaxID=2020716 RepID=UPI00201DEAE3|nr:hypothetical protein [Paenibacillus konkukensis]
MDVTHVKRVTIDETSSRGGHQYIPLFVNAGEKRLLLAIEGKGATGLSTGGITPLLYVLYGFISKQYRSNF